MILWCAAIALILIGAAGTVLPALPGATLVFGGIVLAAWIDDFARIPVWLLAILGALTAMAWIVEYAAAALGARRAGASRLRDRRCDRRDVRRNLQRALGSLVHAARSAPRSANTSRSATLRRAGKVGIATWIGLLLGTAAKVAIVFAMIGIFVFALIV